MTRSLRLFGLAALVIAFTTCARATQFIDVPYQLHDPLLWAHLVFRGKVVSISEFASTTDRWGIGMVSGPPLPLVVEKVSLDVEEVFKGSLDDAHIDIAMFKQDRGPGPLPLSVGDEVILAPNFNTTAKQYLLTNYRGILIADGPSWIRPDPALYHFRIDKRDLAISEIEARATSMNPEALTEQADLVLIGKIRSTREEEDLPKHTEQTIWRLDVISILKGTNPGRDVEISMVTDGQFPDWAVPMPKGTQGERWFVFLKRQGDHFIPFAGPNGMLRIDGDHLIYDQAVTLPISLTKLTRIVTPDQGGDHE